MSALAGVAIAGLETPDEIAEALDSLSRVSTSLLEGYRALEARAERVESELSAANAELERKVAELERTRAHLEAVLQALPCGVVVTDGGGRIVRANAAAGAILGLAPEELVARGSHGSLAGPRADGARREVEREDGERRVVASRWSRIAGRECGAVEILDDRTALARLEQRLEAQARMASLGTLAGGIAHEIRNPLNAVLGFARLLERELEAGSRASRWAARIAAGVVEADQIISNLLSFADPERLQLERVEPTELVASAVESATRTLGAAAPRWRVATAVEAPPFVADRIKLRQALRNLVANAIEAQPEGGLVDVSLRLEGGELVLDVCDGGPGVAAHLRARIADPFFTTRAEGTGLGLALVHTIAALHGGGFEVAPDRAPRERGGGARMLLRIPHHPA